jgi:eukaryotic-like serine/threonine-protein kinase
MDPSSSPGQPLLIIGRYALFGALAAGGMATVHLGRLLGPAGFSRTVAIKRLHEQYANDPEFVAGFLDEARLAARIRHPNVVPTLDVVATQGQLFLVMEYVQGESLARLLKTLRKRDALMPMPIAVAVMVGALHGLHAAHEARSEKGEPLQLVHRDVSPQNILIGTDGVARVLDFGVAKAVGRLQTTESGRLKGKVAYMSPEQIRTTTIDRRTDVFAASIVLWEMLAGTRLFDADNEGMVLERVLYADITPPSRHSAEVPPALDEVLLRGLERNVDQRWQTARDMALALEKCMALPSPAQIGDWVESIAIDSLNARAERVAEVESATSDPGNRASQALADLRSSDDATRASGPPLEVQTGSRSASISLAKSFPPAKPRGRLLVLILAPTAALLGISLLIALWMLQRNARHTPAIAPVVPAASAPLEPAVPVASPDRSAALDEGASAGDPPPEPAPSAPPAPAVKPKATRPAPPRADCSVPFVRDELGRKIWKKECL